MIGRIIIAVWVIILFELVFWGVAESWKEYFFINLIFGTLVLGMILKIMNI